MPPNGPDRPTPILALVVDRDVARGRLPEAVRAAAAGGVDWLQVRQRDLGGAALLAFARELAEAARAGRRDVRIVVNRRVDVALALGLDGAHLGFDAMGPADARALLEGRETGPPLVGVSCHSAAEVRAAARAGASYAHLAPIYDPLSKAAERPALGPGALGPAAAAGIPVLAQGGVRPDRCRELLTAGAAGVAVTGAVLGASDPGAAARALRRALDAG